jgi:phenylalanyl-tRNA synthetase alpha chain
VADQPVDLSEEALAKVVSAARHAFDLAGDLDALARAKTEHLGDRSPIALARQALGSLAKADRAVRASGSTSSARRRSGAARAARRVAGRARRRSAGWRRRASMQLPSTRQPIGARHPITISPSTSPTHSPQWAGGG